MDDKDQNEDWDGIIREMIADATESAPTEPGVYNEDIVLSGIPVEAHR